ncbi:MAG: hypothetical protein ACTSWN_09070 [Promethearchaeota archaeon]
MPRNNKSQEIFISIQLFNFKAIKYTLSRLMHAAQRQHVHFMPDWLDLPRTIDHARLLSFNIDKSLMI